MNDHWETKPSIRSHSWTRFLMEALGRAFDDRTVSWLLSRSIFNSKARGGGGLILVLLYSISHFTFSYTFVPQICEKNYYEKIVRGKRERIIVVLDKDSWDFCLNSLLLCNGDRFGMVPINKTWKRRIESLLRLWIALRELKIVKRSDEEWNERSWGERFIKRSQKKKKKEK